MSAISLFWFCQRRVLAPRGHHGYPMMPKATPSVTQSHSLGSQMADIVPPWGARGGALPTPKAPADLLNGSKAVQEASKSPQPHKASVAWSRKQPRRPEATKATRKLPKQGADGQAQRGSGRLGGQTFQQDANKTTPKRVAKRPHLEHHVTPE